MQKSTAKRGAWTLDGEPVERSAHSHTPTLTQRMYQPVKRLLDMLLATTMLIVLSPVFLVVAVLIRRDRLGSVIFRQQRVGKNGKLFCIYKFRTMKDSAPDNMATSELKDTDRYITKLGKLLRNTSLDETPQFFNVLKGDMSLIGPRPLVPSESETHTMRRRKGVYAVRPGLTGLAQINGRDLVTPLEKVGYDAQYLYTYGPVTDLKIFFRSFLIVLSRRGILDGRKVNQKPVVQNVATLRPQQAPEDVIGEPLYVYDRTGSS